MTIENTLVIRDLATLNQWAQQLRHIMWSRNLPTVQFQLQECSFEQNQSFSALACDFKKACGCASGGFFMSVTAAAMVVYYFVSGSRLSNITLLQVLSFVGIAILAAFAGKLLGLLWARWRLLRLATRIQKMIFRVTQQAAPKSILTGG